MQKQEHRAGAAYSSSAASAATSEPSPEKSSWLDKQQQAFKSLITPFSNKEVNNRLLALCFAQALCSVATLIHDTYLPVYLQDVLGLSNTKVMQLVLGLLYSKIQAQAFRQCQIATPRSRARTC